jgi:hypothetical protein
MKAGRGFVLLVPMFAMLVFAQHTTRRPKVEEGKASNMPAPNSSTAYDPFFGEGRAYWERDSLVYVDPHSPRVELYDKDKNVASVKAAIPGYSGLTLSDATVTPDGHLIISGCSRADVGGKIHCFIGLAGRQGRVSPIVDTGRFAPRTISTCDGETVWAMGWLRAPPYFDREGNEPYHVLRLYRLRDGKIVDSELPRRSFAHWPIAGFGSPELTMQCRGSILGIYEGVSNEWIEYDAARSQLTRWKLPGVTHHFTNSNNNGKQLPSPIHVTFITGVAMLDSGTVYASFGHVARDGSARRTMGLFQLKKSGERASWAPVAGAQGTGGEQGAFDELTGTDGKNLVYSRFGEHHWFFSSPPL